MRTQFKKFILIVFLLLSVLSCSAVRTNGNQEKEAIKASKSWLSLIDNGEYAEGWESTAGYFKTRITKEQWINLIPSVRKPLGRVVTRELNSNEFKTTLPGAPDGKYYVIQYNTSFEKKKSAIETITPMLDSDGKWRVSGYFIK